MSRICPKCKITLSDTYNKCPRCGSMLTDTMQKRSGQVSPATHGQAASGRVNLSELIEIHKATIEVYEENGGQGDDESFKYMASKGILAILELGRRVTGPNEEKPEYGLLPGETSGHEVATRLLKEHLEITANSIIISGAFQKAFDIVMGMSEEEWNQ